MQLRDALMVLAEDDERNLDAVERILDGMEDKYGDFFEMTVREFLDDDVSIEDQDNLIASYLQTSRYSGRIADYPFRLEALMRAEENGANVNRQAGKEAGDGKLPEYSRPAKRLAVYLHNNHPDLKGSTRGVVQMLLMHYNPVEGMFPGHDLLAELTGYSKGTVSEACQKAVDAKVLKVRKAYRYGKGKNEPYVYDFPAAIKKAIDLK